MVDLSVKIGTLVLPNPVLVASGTFGNGEEMSELIDVRQLGGIVLKGTTLRPRLGNAPARVVETPAGLLNAIGLQNPGIEETLRDKAPFVKRLGVPCIINVSGESVDEYAELAALSDACEAVDAIELNVSCPNVQCGGIAFGTNEELLRDAVRAARRATRKPLIVKLSPNVTDIARMARIAEAAGADAVSLINTLLGMVIDVKKRRPVLANKVGGLSGPAIRPIAVYMTWKVAQAVGIPVIGMGGIETLEDALQFFIVGASAVQVGTATFYNPRAAVELVAALRAYAEEQQLRSLKELRGTF
ncbi:MAG: dihydroorotate dehydrogenase [bacterium]|nr:dihydroorotate dehydrogenase [bacterium]